LIRSVKTAVWCRFIRHILF